MCVFFYSLCQERLFFLGSVVSIIYLLEITQNVMDRFGNFFVQVCYCHSYD